VTPNQIRNGLRSDTPQGRSGRSIHIHTDIQTDRQRDGLGLLHLTTEPRETDGVNDQLGGVL